MKNTIYYDINAFKVERKPYEQQYKFKQRADNEYINYLKSLVDVKAIVHD
jgi:hypothetical protein